MQPLPLSQRHAFLSYMHEDKAAVDELQEALESAGVRVWRDTQDLWPGEDWQAKIRAAIKADSIAFIACFSSAASRREKSYQYAELALAVDEYQLRPPATSWLFTVRFDECPIPEYSLVGGKTLEEAVQHVDLFGEKKTVQTIRLVQAVGRIVNPESRPSIATDAKSSARAASGTARERADTMKQLLRDPNADIELEDFMRELGEPLRKEFGNDEDFPATVEDRTYVGFFPVWEGQVRHYETALAPVLEPVRLAATYGLPRHNQAWTQFMGLLTARMIETDGLPVLVRLRSYPALILMYVVAIASVSRENYSPLHAFAVSPTVRDRFDPKIKVPLVRQVNVQSVGRDVEVLASALGLIDDGRSVNDETITGLAEKRIGGRFTPMSDHLHALLRDLFADTLSEDADFADAFDQAEVLLDALANDAALQGQQRYGNRGGFGRYTWRHKHAEKPVEALMLEQVERLGAAWGPVASGLFGGDSARAIEALKVVNEYASDVRRRQH
ncbi:hypothetical protein FHX49_000647 [Microbacterium endophyticum]|uniref:TIR domain-containing protein n=1 Tax=Microbacterium endophyticum TaxID=1526412 RepID=A0A7W4V1F5_9MICO|nr:toll/interleukin-1 receptor domain-containing protein [Microbacterium endophyticum]MBB2975106.1 hypothetical protein [Microbacterium endophyticum]NIK37354.1 hypothetical protein [Microbacterium endophyticum]